VLTRAIDLEKGVHRFYAVLVPRFANTPQAPVLQELLAAEAAHGRVLYDALAKIGRQPDESFEALFERLPGELVEGGQSWDALVERTRSLRDQGTVALLEFALELEYSAYDLYKNLADRAALRESRDAFLLLAAQERAHAQAVAKRLAALAKDPVVEPR
jgi:rubrerythrin